MYISRMALRHYPVACVLSLAALHACASPAAPPPPADLLVSTADSAFWVTSDHRGIRMRGEPMLLTRIDGRFQELYVTDDDRSFYDAVFVGQRLFMRDLVRGDSVELVADSLVPRLAREYAAANPRQARLAPSEDASEHPGSTATADLEILGVHGPYLSYEYRTDVDAPDGSGLAGRHVSRRGVVDLRSHHAVTLGELLGRKSAERTIAVALAEWRSALDSLVSLRDEASRTARRMVEAFSFDPESFTLAAHERELRIVFAVPGSVSGSMARPLELTPLAVGAPWWWAGVRDELPAGPDSARVWERDGTQLLARVPADGERAHMLLLDAKRKRWPVGSVRVPVERVLWLDSSVTPESMRALHRAFNEASQYTGDGRIAMARRTTPFHVISHGRSQASLAHGRRIAARHVGADDAGRRERPRSRVRGRDTRDDGQDGGRVRHSSLARRMRHGFRRPRGLPGTDSRGRTGAHEGERELRGPLVDGDRYPD